MLTFEYRDRSGTLHKWTKMDLPPTLQQAMREGLLAIRSYSQAHYLTGPRPQRLGVVSNTLRPSLYTDVERQGDWIIGKIGTRVWYGRMWEIEGNPRVKRYPKRPFLRPAIDDKKAEVFRMFRDVALRQIER